jgi:UDP-N-acetylglucosamine 4,6-dehydratase/5-epimerase
VKPFRHGVLITGGAGFLGRGLTRRLLANGHERVCILSRNEYTQAQMRAEFKDDQRLRWFIGDVRDVDRLERAMESVTSVIHAAALKRIEVGNMNPDEMVKTNVLGSQNVIDAARRAGVSRVLLVSSDKAFEPVSPYGQTKALAESLFLTANKVSPWGPRYAVCRYGNVAGSTGSVIPTWRSILQDGDTVPVTDPDCTRFYMTRDQAVELVLNTLENMNGGELAIPELPAFRLGDLAEAMGALMDVRGIGEWEKRHESMKAGVSSDRAPRMCVQTLREALTHV